MPRPDAFLCGIGYAEDWLRRARRDWRDGRSSAAVRRLMLAEAEIRRARETGEALGRLRDAETPCRTGRPRSGGGWRVVAGLAAAAVLAAGIGYASMWTRMPQRGAAASPSPEVRLREGIGRTIVQLDTGRFLMPESQLPVGVPVDLRTSTPTF